MNKQIRILSGAFLTASLLAGCSSKSLKFDATSLQSDSKLIKKERLTQEQLITWAAADLLQDTIPGMSVDRAYAEIIRDQEGKTIIVGVIDSGIDTEHEDLKNIMWVNPNETLNGKDNDGNGFVDDIHGWNFLGDIIEENMEYTRIVRDYEVAYGVPDKNHQPTDAEAYAFYQKAKAEYDKEYGDAVRRGQYYKSLKKNLQEGIEELKEAMQVEELTFENLSEFKPETSDLKSSRSFLMNVLSQSGGDIDEVFDQLQEGVNYFEGRIESHFNKELRARANKLGDDENDFSITIYGNNQVAGPDPKKEDAKHGTHVAGIIAADRSNTIGINGVAQNVQILSVRAVPDGDEYDKDIAMAFRYAVDNGAKVINTSFGKYFSTHPEKVEEAMRYAATNDVLIVNAAGNDALNLDEVRVYPNDQTPENETEIINNFINVGSLTPSYGKEMVSGFSNYGKKSVDIFAPGSQIYSTTPLDEYEFLQGTSMAAPAVAGIAALIRSYYPKLSAAQVKKIIMDSGLSYDGEVIVGGDPSNLQPFSELSVSGKIANLYNALILASKTK